MVNHTLNNLSPGTTCIPLSGTVHRYTNLDYLRQHTKANVVLMREMIKLYLDQTKSLIDRMEKGFRKRDWPELAAAAHKIRPSLQIMGLNSNCVAMAKELEEAAKQIQREGVDAVKQMTDNLISMAATTCTELEEELNNL